MTINQFYETISTAGEVKETCLSVVELLDLTVGITAMWQLFAVTLLYSYIKCTIINEYHNYIKLMQCVVQHMTR